MDFEWDEAKAQANRVKHGVSFDEATEIFADVHASCVPDPDHSCGEARYLLFGLSAARRYIVVSFAERSDAIRIISARYMTRPERNAYER